MYSNELIIKILEYIDKNLYKKITMDELSRVFFYNKDYIMRLFKRELGITIIDYINKKRIYLSLESLKNRNNSILNVALKHGFVYQEYYTEIFRKLLGVSPSTFRNYNNFYYDINDDSKIKLSNNLSTLYYEIKKIEKYKTNIKKTDSKVLSIFK